MTLDELTKEIAKYFPSELRVMAMDENGAIYDVLKIAPPQGPGDALWIDVRPVEKEVDRLVDRRKAA